MIRTHFDRCTTAFIATRGDPRIAFFRKSLSLNALMGDKAIIMFDEALLGLARDFKQRSGLQIEWLTKVADVAILEKDDERLNTAMSLSADFRIAVFLFDIALMQPYDQEQRAKACEKGIDTYRNAIDRLFSARMAGLDRRVKP